MKIAANERSQVLAGRLSEIAGVPLVDTQFRVFPDGEQYLKMEGGDDTVIIVGAVTGDASFVQTLLMIDACGDAEKILVLPYMAYARQDKLFNEGEALSARVVMEALSAGVDRVITVNIHEKEVIGYAKAPATNVTVAPAIGDYIATLGLDNPLILGPDSGAAGFAADVAKSGPWESDHLFKTRLSGSEVEVRPKNLDAAGRDAVVVDDIISTGGTIATAAGMLSAQGARSVSAICAHGVFASGAYMRLKAAGILHVCSTDTYECGCSRISAAGVIAGELEKHLSF